MNQDEAEEMRQRRGKRIVNILKCIFLCEDD